jgi:CBS domain containing-hemolysin-like protein
MIFVLVLTIVLLALNGLFVAAEFAIVAAPRHALQRRASEGHKTAKLVLKIRENPALQDQYIATAQLGITLATLGLGMYSEHHFSEWLFHYFEQSSLLQTLAVHSVAALIVVALLTYFHVVIGEMIPKSLALQKAESVVLWITPIMMSFRWLMYPLVIGLNAFGNGILAIMGIRRTAGSHLSTLQDLQYIVSQSQEAGALGKETAEVLQELLAFTDTDAGELMVPRVRMAALDLESTPQEVRQALIDDPHSRYPVYENNLDQVLGFVHLQDLYHRLRQPKLELPVQRQDLHDLPFLPATAELETVLQTMHREQLRMVILIDEYGGTAGLITLEDILAELVGPIEPDEIHDAELREHGEGQLMVEGTLRLDELGEHLGLDLEHDEVETVSGLVLDILERPPREGDEVDYHGLHFKVTSVQGRGVGRCEVTVLPKAEN